MSCRAGITTDLERRKKEHEAEYPTLSNWESFGPFDSREDAQAWEDKKRAEHGCDGSPGGDEPDDPNATWYGYHFYY